jgi:methionine-rich copper-binding protein CopC
MKKVHFLEFLAVATLALVVLANSAAAFGDSLTAPIRIATSTASDGPTLGIPRWKAYMLETDPNQFWACYANGSRTLSNMSYTTDGGNSWSTNAIQIDPAGYLDMHCSVFGRNGILYATWPGRNGHIAFRKFRAPIHSNTDGDPLVSIAGTASGNRSNIMVQITGRIWLFTRLSYASTSENVLYNYSDDEGVSWTNGTAYATNSNSVRIGSMPYAGGNPALVVLYLDDARGFEYYLWNGTSFEAKPDHSIYGVNMGQTRVFTHNVVRDTTFHIIFGDGTSLHHVWKNFNNGSGSWNHQVIDNSTTTMDNDWYPTSTVRGDDLYLFYCKKSSTNNATSMVYYKKWSQLTQTWTEPLLVSTNAGGVNNRDPNTCFHVPSSSPYVPVIWRSGTKPFDVFFAKVIVSPDTIVPPVVYDLEIASHPTTEGTTNPPTGISFHPEGTRVSVAASAAPGYVFASWTGAVDDPTAPSTTILMNGDKILTANFVVALESIGSIHGLVSVGATGLQGVYVDLLNFSGGSVMRVTTDSNGYYMMPDLPSGHYIVDLTPPLGFGSIGSPSILVTLAEIGIKVDFNLYNITTGSIADYWWWRSQVQAIRNDAPLDGGITNDDVDRFCASIYDHYYNRTDGFAMRIDGVTCTGSPAGALTFDDVANIWFDIIDGSNAARIRKHLLACLLNIASDRLSQRAVVSVDGATASQAITYLAGRYMGGAVDDGTIWYNLSLIHTEVMIAAGVIPLSTPNIMYKPEEIDPINPVPNAFALLQNYPNPFNPTTTIKFSVPERTNVTISVYNLLGAEVTRLVDRGLSAGNYQVVWNGLSKDGQSVSTGIYLYRIQAGNYSETRKMLLLK